MSNILFLYNYNNYFNRIVKRLETVAEYKLAAGTGKFFEVSNTNIDVTDGVNAKHVFNLPKTADTYDNMSPNYAVITHTDGTISRWYVLEAIKQRGKQYEVTLRRDVIADFLPLLQNSPIFVQKGMLPLSSNLIFNKESMTFNQIKKSEILLKDKTKSAWIVGYLARGTSQPEEYEISARVESRLVEKIEYQDLEDDEQAFVDSLIDAGNNYQLKYIPEKDFQLRIRAGYLDELYLRTKQLVLQLNSDNEKYIEGIYLEDVRYSEDPYYYEPYKLNKFAYLQLLSQNPSVEYDENNDDLIYYLGEITNEFLDNTIPNEMYERLNRKIIVKNNRDYTMDFQLEDVEPDYEIKTTLNNKSDNFGKYVNNIIDNLEFSEGSVEINENFNRNDTFASIKGKVKIYKCRAVETSVEDVTVTIPRTRAALLDAPYDMFAMPLDSIEYFYNGVVNTTESYLALPLARQIALVLGKSNVYDIQILPYCPVQNLFIEGTDQVDLDFLTEHYTLEFITRTDSPEERVVSFMIFPRNSRGSFTIDMTSFKQDYEQLNLKTNPVDKKIASETDLIRFVSPNFSAMFDFNLQKNNGMDEVSVDFDYRPYSPYIHVSPVFSGLYGRDFNDPKGLICSGDFSITTASNQFVEYTVQNKTFELAFNRSIENMDVNNSIAYDRMKTEGIINTITSGLFGAAGGAVAGGSIGGPIGMAVGAVVGGIASPVASGVGMAMDLGYLAKQQSENRSYAVDMYNFNLQNIKALPNTLTKVSAFTQNNKVFPFIEIYTCTNEEKQALRDKIAYNGMSVMKIDTLGNYIQPGAYFCGELIRLEGLTEDNHLVTEIYNELKKGVYF